MIDYLNMIKELSSLLSHVHALYGKRFREEIHNRVQRFVSETVVDINKKKKGASK
jgi:hypothetical protein